MPANFMTAYLLGAYIGRAYDFAPAGEVFAYGKCELIRRAAHRLETGRQVAFEQIGSSKCSCGLGVKLR